MLILALIREKRRTQGIEIKNWFNSPLSLQDIMNSEKSYDSLPNFTAADCEFPPHLLRFRTFLIHFPVSLKRLLGFHLFSAVCISLE